MTSLPQQKGGEVTGCFYAVLMWVLLCGAYAGAYVGAFMLVLLCGAYGCTYDCAYPVALAAHEGEQDFSHLLTVCPREDI